jgi:uncharacterized protein with NAD-binding domain and iron-sulfur cluster
VRWIYLTMIVLRAAATPSRTLRLFAATPEQNARRPGVRTAWRNLALAGDWTDTGLPATIESAVRSGHQAADFAIQP